LDPVYNDYTMKNLKDIEGSSTPALDALAIVRANGATYEDAFKATGRTLRGLTPARQLVADARAETADCEARDC